MPFPTFVIEDLTLPRVICGTNSLLGYSHVSRGRDTWVERYYTPRRMAEVFVRCMALGAGAVMGPVHPVLVDALQETRKLTGEEMVWVSTTSHLMGQERMDEQLQILRDAGAPICFFHGQWTDRWPEREGHLDGYSELTARVRDAGMIPATSVHLSDRLAFVDQGDYDIAAFATPVNSQGFSMHPDRETALRHIANARRPVLAIKALSCGRFEPGTLEESLRWVVAQEGVEAVIIGVMCAEEAEESVPILQDAFAEKMAAVPA